MQIKMYYLEGARTITLSELSNALYGISGNLEFNQLTARMMSFVSGENVVAFWEDKVFEWYL